MILPRLTVRAMSFAVLLFAVDCAILRFIFTALISSDNVILISEGLLYGVLGVLPMSNILAFGFYRYLNSRAERSQFLVGFEVVGLMASTAWLLVCLVNNVYWLAWFDDLVASFAYTLLHVRFPGPHENISRLARTSYTAIGVTIIFVLTTPPQLLLALSGGLLARRISKRRVLATTTQDESGGTS